MSAEEFIRYLSSLVGVAGLATLAAALGQSFGLWAAGLALFIAGFAIGVPLWSRHFEYSKDAREAERLRPEQAPKAKEESPY
jgi:hypothetical protein